MKIEIPPLSVNEAWTGKRFKTKKYRQYVRDVLFLLPKIKLPDPPFKIVLIFGMSNIMSDFDNPVKPFVDILQKKYEFNDRHIMEAHIKKVRVENGKEFIEWELTTQQ
jgi:Holliday junction resolvase RusA-like endonuclease